MHLDVLTQVVVVEGVDGVVLGFAVRLGVVSTGQNASDLLRDGGLLRDVKNDLNHSRARAGRGRMKRSDELSLSLSQARGR